MKKNFFINNFFKKHDLNVTDNDIDELKIILSNERLSLQNDLKKILIFTKANPGNIRGSYKLISSTQPEDLTKLTFLLASKNKGSFGKNS